MSAPLPWFRLYHRIIDDEKIRLLAFEDRWHFIALCCLKCEGLLDEHPSDLKWRKTAVKMGVQSRELDEIRRRLQEVGLVDDDMNPVAWDVLQYKGDVDPTASERQRRKRLRDKDKNTTTVTVTRDSRPPDTDTDTEKEKELCSLEDEFEREFWPAYPHKQQKGDALKAYRAARRKTAKETILAGLKAYIANKEDWRQWKLPGPWLRAEAWADEWGDSSEMKSQDDPAVLEAVRYQIEQSIKHGDVSEAQIQFYRQHFGEPDGVVREVQDADVWDVHGSPTGRVQPAEVGGSSRDGDGGIQSAAGLARVFPVDAVFSGAARNTTDRARGAFARQRG